MCKKHDEQYPIMMPPIMLYAVCWASQEEDGDQCLRCWQPKGRDEQTIMLSN